MPRVTVLFPVFNAGAYLPLALASLLEQTHRNLTILALDDGSTDGSLALLQAAADMDPRVEVLSRPNRGLITTLNEGLELADSDHIARMDADDIAYPDRITAQLAAFEADTRLGLLGTNFTTLYAPNRLSPAAPPVLTGAGERAVLGRFCTSLRHPTVMVRRSRLGHGTLAYDPAYPCAEDFDLFRRLALTTGLAELPAPHLAYRLHAGSVSMTRQTTMTRTHVRVLEENLSLHYPQASGTGFERIADHSDDEGVQAAAAMIRALDQLAPHQPDAERAGYELGVTNTVHFLYSLLCHRKEYASAYRFIDLAGRWRSIRRRERMMLPLPIAPIAMTVSDWQCALQRALAARAPNDLLPGFDVITRRARLLAQAAGQEPARHAA